MALTPEEKKERKRESQRKWLEKQKEAKALDAAPDYEAMYKKAKAEIETLATRCAELERLCHSYAETAQANKQALQKATLEYNTRTNYMLDCARHAYTSMAFAQNAAEKKGE